MSIYLGHTGTGPAHDRSALRRFTMTNIPKSHPRYDSLVLRERLVAGFNDGIVAAQGLIAHGRGEMFYYLLGERTTKQARTAERAAAALMLLAKNPVISVNGNVAALCPGEVVRLAEVTGAKIEVGLFHRSDQRVAKIQTILEDHGAKDVLGLLPDARLDGVDSMRGLCCGDGIHSADVVLIPLEDGDRAEALSRMGKKTIVVDLNPLSRTSRSGTVAIVDEVTKALPEISLFAEELEDDASEQERLLTNYDRDANLQAVMNVMQGNLGKLG